MRRLLWCCGLVRRGLFICLFGTRKEKRAYVVGLLFTREKEAIRGDEGGGRDCHKLPMTISRVRVRLIVGQPAARVTNCHVPSKQAL